MPFELPADPGDPGRPSTGIGRLDGARARAHHLLVRDGAQVLARGALICPECDLPMATAGAIPVAALLRCGFCDHLAPARRFMAVDTYDTVGNEAQLVARIRRAPRAA